MTVAICIRCGNRKTGAFVACGRCDFQPHDDCDLALSLGFTDHHVALDVLDQVGRQLAAGHSLPRISPEAEAKLIEAVRGPGFRKMLGADSPIFGPELDVQSLRTAVASVRAELGTLDDLPEKLSEIVVAVFYKSESLLGEQRPAGWVLAGVGADGKGAFDPSRLVEGTVGILAKRQAITPLVKALRSIDPKHQPRLYDYTVELILDVLVFEIPNAMKKSGAWRAIQRRFRRPTIQPVPGLRARVIAKLAAHAERPTVRMEAEQSDTIVV